MLMLNSKLLWIVPLIQKHKDMGCAMQESLIIHKKFPKSQTIKILNALSDQGVEIREAAKRLKVFLKKRF